MNAFAIVLTLSIQQIICACVCVLERANHSFFALPNLLPCSVMNKICLNQKRYRNRVENNIFTVCTLCTLCHTFPDKTINNYYEPYHERSPQNNAQIVFIVYFVYLCVPRELHCCKIIKTYQM